MKQNIKSIILAFYLCIFETKSDDIKNSNKHNVLAIIVDDLRHLADETVHLPNIQKMAVNGIRFQHAYAQQALCAPSRNSILTGRRPDSLHLYDFYSYWREAVGNFTTLPQLFKENGYESYSVGKVFHPGRSSNYTDDYPYSWSQPPYHPPSEIYKDAAVCKTKKSKKPKKNLICPVVVDEQPDYTLPDIEILNQSIRILEERNSTKPFFLAVGFHKPHIPLKYPKRFLDQVPLSKVSEPSFPSMPENMPLVAWHPWTDVRNRDDIKRLHIPFPMGTMPKRWTLKIRQSYYAAVLYIDQLIGALIEHVDRKNTIIVLTSDHGWSLGENGLWAKYSNFDVALRVPLIFDVPGMLPKSISTPVELLDIFPTLVHLTGIKQNIPKCKHDDKSILCFEGKSLAPLMRRKKIYMKHTVKSFAFSQYPRPSVNPSIKSDKPRLKNINIMGYSVKTNRYRYTQWISFNNTSFKRNWDIVHGIELYDHFYDPNESNNVYWDLHYKRVKSKLAKLLRSRVELSTRYTGKFCHFCHRALSRGFRPYY